MNKYANLISTPVLNVSERKALISAINNVNSKNMTKIFKNLVKKFKDIGRAALRSEIMTRSEAAKYVSGMTKDLNLCDIKLSDNPHLIVFSTTFFNNDDKPKVYMARSASIENFRDLLINYINNRMLFTFSSNGSFNDKTISYIHDHSLEA